MRVLIAEDELPARQLLKGLLQRLNSAVDVVAEVGDGQAAVDAVDAQTVDVVLMDIRMPGKDGLSAALEIAKRDNAPAVIFVTAFDEHALQAFEANAIDYLLKPVRQERLAKALDKAARLTLAQQQALSVGQAQAITVSYRGGVRRIPLDEVIYLRADQKYVEVCYQGGIALSDASLRQLEEQFPGRFLRIHRNALVDPERLSELVKEAGGQMQLRLSGCDSSLEVSRRHVHEVRQRLKGVAG